MWGSLKKDFGEFVSTVANDATDALQQLDQGLEGEGTGEGQGATLIDPDTGMPIEYDAPEMTTTTSTTMKMPSKPEDATVEEMKDFLMTYDAVFLDTINVDDDADAASFLQAFDIGTKTDEITKLLDEHKETLEPTFSRLTDQVEYADFWQRYFYRIDSDDERLKDTYGHYYDQYMKDMAAKDPKYAAKAALSNVTNFLGGVVHRLVDENDADDSADEDEEIVEDNVPSRFGTSTAAAVNFLSGGSRAPFGLNPTAGSKVVDDEEDDEEEEELGWDDDDDDDDDLEDDDDDDDQNVTVEFKDVEKEKLQEELLQAQEERDMLHKTVAMQTEEIKKLREAAQPAIVAGDDETNQVKILQMQLFEKDSELAALRAQLDDIRSEDDEAETKPFGNDASPTKEIERLNEVIVSKDKEIAELVSSKNELEQYKEVSSTQAVESDSKKAELKELVAAKDAEIARLQASQNVDQNFEAEASAAAAETARELDSLKESFATKEKAFMEAEQSRLGEISDLRSQLDRANTEKNALQESLQAQIDDLRNAKDISSSNAENKWKELITEKEKEIANLNKALDEVHNAHSNMKRQLEAAEVELTRSKSEASKTAELLDIARKELLESRATTAHLQHDLDHAIATLKQRDEELLLNAKRPSSPGSSSTGVKISTDTQSQDESVAVVESTVTKLDAGGDDDDDGWGDDW